MIKQDLKNWIWWQKYWPLNYTDESGHISTKHSNNGNSKKIFQGRESFKREWDKPKFNPPAKIGFK